MGANDFYEDDEPVEDVVAAFESGEKRITRKRGQELRLRRYVYSVVRCLPAPRTGEFVNVGAIAGDPASGDWAYRHLDTTERVRRFAGQSALAVALDYLRDLGERIDHSNAALRQGRSGSLPHNWLERLHRDHRNVVQFSIPAPVLADNSEEALAFVFAHVLAVPNSTTEKVEIGGAGWPVV